MVSKYNTERTNGGNNNNNVRDNDNNNNNNVNNAEHINAHENERYERYAVPDGDRYDDECNGQHNHRYNNAYNVPPVEVADNYENDRYNDPPTPVRDSSNDNVRDNVSTTPHCGDNDRDHLHYIPPVTENDLMALLAELMRTVQKAMLKQINEPKTPSAPSVVINIAGDYIERMKCDDCNNNYKMTRSLINRNNASESARIDNASERKGDICRNNESHYRQHRAVNKGRVSKVINAKKSNVNNKQFEMDCDCECKDRCNDKCDDVKTADGNLDDAFYDCVCSMFEKKGKNDANDVNYKRRCKYFTKCKDSCKDGCKDSCNRNDETDKDKLKRIVKETLDAVIGGKNNESNDCKRKVKRHLFNDYELSDVFFIDRGECKQPCKDECDKGCKDESKDECKEPCDDKCKQSCKDECKDECKRPYDDKSNTKCDKQCECTCFSKDTDNKCKNKQHNTLYIDIIEPLPYIPCSKVTPWESFAPTYLSPEYDNEMARHMKIRMIRRDKMKHVRNDKSKFPTCIYHHELFLVNRQDCDYDEMTKLCRKLFAYNADPKVFNDLRGFPVFALIVADILLLHAKKNAVPNVKDFTPQHMYDWQLMSDVMNIKLNLPDYVKEVLSMYEGLFTQKLIGIFYQNQWLDDEWSEIDRDIDPSDLMKKMLMIIYGEQDMLYEIHAEKACDEIMKRKDSKGNDDDI